MNPELPKIIKNARKEPIKEDIPTGIIVEQKAGETRIDIDSVFIFDFSSNPAIKQMLTEKLPQFIRAHEKEILMFHAKLMDQLSKEIGKYNEEAIVHTRVG